MDGRGQKEFGNAGYKHSVSSGYGQKMGNVKLQTKTTGMMNTASLVKLNKGL
jgi:hypothetical protein